MDGWAMIAEENHRGIWRGKFIEPERWRKGERLPGEPGETESEREPLGALMKFDPIITLDESRPGRPVIAIQFRANALVKATDEALAWVKSFRNLRSLDVPSTSMVTDAGLEQLAGLTQLVELNVNWTKVTAARVVNLVKGRRMMRRLEVAGVKFRDEDLAMLKGLPYLRNLSLRATLVTDKGLAHLKPFDQLRALSLMSTEVSDSGLEHVASLSALEDLDLDRTAITDDGLANLEGLSNLRRLQMAHTAITDAGLEHLESLANLKALNVRGTKVSKVAFDQLKQRLPGLERESGPATQ
jgi:hypothetical protein